LNDLRTCVISWQAARQIEFLVGRSSLGLFTSSLEDAMGIAQHHDAVSGTAKQHTTDDYSKRLALGASKVENGVNTALTCLTSSNRTCVSSVTKFEQVTKCALDFLCFPQ
jgi:alpha-mannosidase